MKLLSNYKNLVFDTLYWFFSFLIYGISLMITFKFANAFWSQDLWKNVIVVLLSYFIFIHCFILAIGLFKRIFQRPLKVGKMNAGLNKDYFSFALNSAFHGIFFTSPIYSQVGIVSYLRTFYYRLMGMKLSVSNIIGTDTLIRQPELIELGEKTVLGIGSILSCHFSSDGKTHFQGKVKIGKNSLVGAYAQVCPDCTVGDETVIGSRSILYPGVVIGNNVQIGLDCRVFFGAKIPDNCTLKGMTVITKNDNIQEGETWSGNPARLISKRKNE